MVQLESAKRYLSRVTVEKRLTSPNQRKQVRENFLRKSVSGEFVACLGVSEAGGGSDVAALKTTAVRDGDDFIINGSKMWTTSGTQADWMCLLANTSDEGAPHFNKTLMCLDMKSEGVRLVALRCVVLRWVALCCVVLRCVALCCVVLRWVVPFFLFPPSFSSSLPLCSQSLSPHPVLPGATASLPSLTSSGCDRATRHRSSSTTCACLRPTLLGRRERDLRTR